MKQIETCKLCKLGIETKKDNFVQLIDYRLGKFLMEGFYHTKCFTDNINASKQMKEKTMKLLNSAGKLIGMKEEEVYQIG